MMTTADALATFASVQAQLAEAACMTLDLLAAQGDTMTEIATETTTIKATEILNAQLFWDDQDDCNTGWWLRYYDSTGQEQGAEIDGIEDATTEDLAAACAAALPGREGDIRVIRGGERRGRISLRGDEAPDWRAGS